jgi:hypothetical protein
MYNAIVDNKFLLMKCMALGAFSFPCPVLIFLFLFNLNPIDETNRAVIVILLLLSGSIVGMTAFYKDKTIIALKDWVPSESRRGLVNSMALGSKGRDK